MTDAYRRKARLGKSHARSSKRIFSLTPLAAAIVATLGPAGPALAQEDEGDSGALDEIIVTATKRELNLQDVPHSIDVLSATELKRMGAKDIEATLRALPSVHLTALQPGQNSLVVRGISTGAYEYRTEAQVAVYLDEQPLTFNSQQVGVRNIDMLRIENLPGPQGTLFGSSSQTGTIRYITNKPNMSGFGGQVEGRYGTTSGGEDSFELNGYVNIPMGDSFAIRAVGYTSHDGGYVDNIFGTSFSGNYDNADLVEDDFNEYDVDGGRLHALWTMNENWSALFTVVAENTDSTGVWDTDASLGDYKITRFEEEVRFDDWVSTSVTLDGALGFADVSFTAAKFERDIVYEYDNMTYAQQKDAFYGGGLYRSWVAPPFPPGPPASNPYYNYGLYDGEYHRSLIFNDQTQERESLEFRLVSSGDSRFQWMVGGFYEDIIDKWYYGTRVEDLTDTRSWAYAQAYAIYYDNPNSPYPLADTDVGYSNTLDRSISQIAAFGELSFDVTDDLTVHGGYRWAEYDRDIYSRFAFPEGLSPFGDIDEGGNGDFRDVGIVDDSIFKIGVRYNLDDDRMLYGLYSQGFRLGGINSPRAAGTGKVPQVYKPDYLENYEFGIKSQWLNHRLTINADIFYMQWTDYQQGASFPQWWLRGTVNAGKVETKGIEVQAVWQATERLHLTASVFSADPEFSDNWCNDYVGGVYQGCVVDGNGDVVGATTGDPSRIVAGMIMPNSPKSTGHASIYYTFPDVFGGDLWLYYDISYSSEVWNNISSIRNNRRDGLAPSWTYSSFSAGLQLPNELDIELNVRNLFDQKGYSYVATWEAGYAEVFGDPRYQRIRAQDRPRTIWLTLRKGFGTT